MPYVTTLISEGTGIVRRGESVLTGKDMIAEARANRSSGVDWSRITHFILDFEGVESFEVSTAEVHTLAAIAKDNADLFAGLKVLAIAAPADLQFGLARMFEAYHGLPGLEVGVFRSMAELMAWLPTVLSPQPE